ncbi:MAG TPA: helix-turn-helix transcriptional regulator [Blastocatellia bacterium]|nr:helix-turn-helix transcriptional regulator [Blastocatellia bacterium]
MIRNEREYRITKAQAKKFQQALAQLPKERPREKGVHPRLVKAQNDALQSQLQSLRQQINEYERLRRGGGKGLDVTSIEKLPQNLIRARIAAGLTQKELATRIGIKEQQVQRYEATNYASASLARVLQVARILGQQA